MTTTGERNVLRLCFAKFLCFLHIFSDINANTFDFRQIICYIYFAKQFLQSLSGVRTFLFLKFIFFHTTGEFLQKCKLRLRLCAFPYHVRIVWRQSEFAFWCVGSCRRIFVFTEEMQNVHIDSRSVTIAHVHESEQKISGGKKK